MIVTGPVKIAVLFLASLPVLGQMCSPPTPMSPNAAINGAIDSNSCVLTDGTSYVAYALTIPRRGNLQLTLKGAAGFAPSLILRDAGGHLLASGASITYYSEAGTYTLLVNTARAKQSGSFTLTPVFTPEPYTYCRTFPSLGTGQTVNGNLTASSCKLPDQSLYDSYPITVYGAGTITVTMTSAAFDSFVILQGDNGSPLAQADAGGAGNPASITLPVSGNDTYTIVAAAGSSKEPTGAYQLSTSFTPNAGETCVSQGALDQNPVISGSVSVSSCNFNLPNREDSALFNFYTLHVSQIGMAQVSVPDSSFGPLLLLLDANGNEIAENAQSGGENSPLLRQQLSPGDYMLVIFNQDSFEGDYDLQYTFTPGTEPVCPAAALTGGNAVTGTLDGTASCLESGFLADRYQIVLPVAGTVNIDLSSQDFTSLLFLEDAKNNALYFGEDTDDNGSSHIQIRLPAGTYYALAASADLPGGYTINYAVTPGPIPACPAPKSIPVANGSSNGFNGTLSFTGSCSSPNGALSNNYTFTTTASGAIAAVMVSGDVDSLLFLADSKGNPLRFDNNSYSQGNAIIVDYLPAGTYKLQATSDGFQNQGNYQIDLLFTAAGSDPKTCAAKNAAVGKSITGLLSYTSCQYLDDTFADIYSVTITDASNPLDIAATSTAFDTYLILLDNKGNVLGIDDNSGGGTNAHLIQNVAVGSYFVVVKPASDPSSSGSYALSIH
jgi:hypothetical protein